MLAAPPAETLIHHYSVGAVDHPVGPALDRAAQTLAAESTAGHWGDPS